MFRITIGTIDITCPATPITHGPLAGFCQYQADGLTCLVHSRWCKPANETTTATDTDWRRFLRTHWDTRRNHLQADATAEFMAIFTRAAAAYYTRHNQKPNEPIMPIMPNEPIMPSTPITTHSPHKPHYVQLSLFPTI